MPGTGDSPELVLRRLSKFRTQWLLVIDNADCEESQEIEPFLPYGYGLKCYYHQSQPWHENIGEPEWTRAD